MSAESRFVNVMREHRIERCSVASSDLNYQWGRCVGCDFESEYVPIKGVDWDQLHTEIVAVHLAAILTSVAWPEITTPKELDALPEETVINDAFGCTAKKYKTQGGESVWWWIATADPFEPDLPAVVLCNPEDGICDE